MIELVIEGKRRSLGGFDVARVLPFAERRMVGPFVFFDHLGPLQVPPNAPREMDVRPHPHIGLSTVTYLFAGEITHRDSLGSHALIVPGEVNWMTAGRGISHSERFDKMRERGGPLHGIQSWVALPDEDEETAPAFVHFDAGVLPSGKSGGVSWRVIAGEAFGVASPVKTHSPLFYVHLEMQPRARTKIAADYSDRAAYVVAGSVRIEDREFSAHQMPVFTPDSEPTIEAVEASTVMLLGGEPLGARHIWWNFVSSRKERIEQAKADWKAGRIPLPAGDDREFIPLPEEPAPPAPPMS
jgi:hypothetical protein